MRAVVQRVSTSSVSIKDKVEGSIGKGLLLLLGIEQEDGAEDIQWLCQKIVNMRIFSDEEGKINLSLIDIQGELLVVSQFTLHASTKKGNRPSFIKAAPPAIAVPLYEDFIQEMETLLGRAIATGQFGADMQVNLVNDGPVTIIIDSKDRK